MSLSSHQSARTFTCISCRSSLSSAAFGLRSGVRRSACKSCTNAANKASRQRVRDSDPVAYSVRSIRYNKETRERRGPERESEMQRRGRLKNKYGLSVADFDRMLSSQDGVCAVCARPSALWSVDHDHASGAVRGILCRHCNLGLGHFKDDSARLAAAIAYLKATR